MPARPRTVPGRLISLGDRPTTAAATPCAHFAALAAPPSPIRRRALEFLAASRDGATEAVMRAHGFTVDQIGRAHGPVARRFEIARVRITEGGAAALGKYQ